MRRAILALSVCIPLVALAPSAVARVHRCAPTNAYWSEIRIDHLSCGQAYRLHKEKLRDCSYGTTRRVTRTAYVFTCYFGRWTSTERVNRRGTFFDYVYIRRDRGRIWLRYSAAP